MTEREIAAALAADFAAAWNRHDTGELAGLFHDDAGFVNVLGVLYRGREEIRRQHALVHAGPYRESVLQAELVDARKLGPDVIVAHIRTEVAGDARAPGQTRASLLTVVIQRRTGLWRFAAAHNTQIVPPAL